MDLKNIYVVCVLFLTSIFLYSIKYYKHICGSIVKQQSKFIIFNQLCKCKSYIHRK